ncbi:MAG: hypothetical protein GQ540_02020 [Lutibacter sp.]|uniref:hypothetical protein n=1 Tax=Lutibacter sp. TaxID=1925666 RepID=UPI0019DEF317|nr:hypothetical protein [Lutibacter sp.]NOR27284.1 hypothetical protein [Lutibacter sp.]
MRKPKQNYESIKEFIKRANISRTTLHRFYVNNPDLKNETIKKKIKREIPIGHAKYFDREELIDEVRLLEDKVESMRRFIDMVENKESLPARLWEMPWSFFGTISHSHDLSKDSCYRQMTRLFDELDEQFGASTSIRLFFTTEAFKNRNGHHNHFVLFIDDDWYHQKIIEKLYKMYSNSRIELQPYNKYEAGIFYITKDGLQGENWDILYNLDNDEQLQVAS